MKAKICHLKVPSCTSSVGLLQTMWPVLFPLSSTSDWRYTCQGMSQERWAAHPGPCRTAAISLIALSREWYFLLFCLLRLSHQKIWTYTEQGSGPRCKTTQVPVTCSSQTEQGLPTEPVFPQNNRKWDIDLAPWLKPQEKGITKKIHCGSQWQVKLFRKVTFTFLCPMTSTLLPQNHPQWTQTWPRPPNHHSDLAAGSYQKILWLKRS